jgi:hypothetical protein
MATSAKRTSNGALIADYAVTLYVLFLFLVFPLLDASVLGMRAFFLWFAANQATMAACKAKTYLEPVEIPGKPGAVLPSACELARLRANQIKTIFPGIHWEESKNNPDVQIVQQPINPQAKNAKPQAVFSRGSGAPLSSGNAPDPTLNVYVCRVVIKGRVDPLVSLPWFDVPGLSRSFDLTVSSQAQYENPSGLVI